MSEAKNHQGFICPNCGVADSVLIEEDSDVLTGVRLIEEVHKQASPDCRCNIIEIQVFRQEEKEGALRVWWISNPPNRGVNVYVPSAEVAVQITDREVKRQLTNKRIYANVFGLEVYEEGEWCEWYDNDGRTIEEFAEKLEREK